MKEGVWKTGVRMKRNAEISILFPNLPCPAVAAERAPREIPEGARPAVSKSARTSREINACVPFYIRIL